jgi:Fic family protein
LNTDQRSSRLRPNLEYGFALIKDPSVGRYEVQHWSPDFTAPGGRQNRRAFAYKAFVPDPIADCAIDVPADIAERVVAAEVAVRRLDVDVPPTLHLDALARRLLRAESVASSWIEGLRLSQRRLARAELGLEETDGTARAVVNNVAAMDRAIQLARVADPFSVRNLLEVHGVLMQHARDSAMVAPGQLRTRQNWIGGTSHNPLRAAYVPPPPQYVPGLMEDLARYMARTDVPSVVQAAVAHAQFENIHPFGDGNGRVGRALIHVVLLRRGVAPRVVPPVSLVLATDGPRYIDGLRAHREGRTHEWIGTFADALATAAGRARDLGRELGTLIDEWRGRLGHPRADASASILLSHLPACPVLTVEGAAQLLGRSRQAANVAVGELAEARILTQVTVGRRNRAFEAMDLVHLMDRFERELAIPAERERPVRAAPAPHRKTERDPFER